MFDVEIEATNLLTEDGSNLEDLGGSRTLELRLVVLKARISPFIAKQAYFHSGASARGRCRSACRSIRPQTTHIRDVVAAKDFHDYSAMDKQ